MDRVATVIRTPLYEAGLDQKTMYIALTDDATDAAPELRPLQPVTDGDTNDVDYFEEAGNKLDRLWRTKLGKYLYDCVVKEDLKKEGIRRAFLLLCSQSPSLTCSPLPAILSSIPPRRDSPCEPPQTLYPVGSQERESCRPAHRRLPPW